MLLDLKKFTPEFVKLLRWIAGRSRRSHTPKIAQVANELLLRGAGDFVRGETEANRDVPAYVHQWLAAEQERQRNESFERL